MKKLTIIKYLLVVFALSLVLLLATGCGKCDHTGGTATCSSQAVCTKCNQPYGELVPDNHTGGTATCTNKAICQGCNKPYGYTDSNNHTQPPTWGQTASKHWQYYSCCEAIVVASSSHEWQNGVCAMCGYGCHHTGGTATCIEQATCTNCGQKYGSIDRSAHVGSRVWEKTSTTHKQYYSCCNLVTISTTAHNMLGGTCASCYYGCDHTFVNGECTKCFGKCNHSYTNGICSICQYACQHTGGTATCSSQATCSVCSTKYGQTNSANHTGTLLWEKTSTTHKQYYNCCNAVVLSATNHNWQSGVCSTCQYACAHTGGTATCTQLAICTNCNTPYGSFATHTYASQYTTNSTHHWQAATCGCSLTKNYGTHSVDSSGWCTVCNQGVTDTEGVWYEASTDGTYAEVIAYTGTASKVKIADTYNGLPVKSIVKDAFKDAKITQVAIPISVTSIGSYAFSGCSSLTSVVIPNSVTSIGSYAFSDCTNLKSITIPDSVTTIGSYAFSDCTKLTKVNYLGTIEQWNQIYFASASSNPLYYAKKLYLNDVLVTDVVLTTATKISSYAFYNCTSLTSIVIPNSVTTIGDSAFNGCTKLTTIKIPNSVTSIGGSAFSGCSSLQEITLPFVGAKAGVTSSDTYQYPFGYIFGTSSYTSGKATKQYYYGSSTSSATYSTYYIPTSLKKVTITGGYILYGAFENCSNLTNITLGNSVTTIGDYAFSDCTNLKSITIPNSVISIGIKAFDGCTSLVYNTHSNVNYLGNQQNPYHALITVTTANLPVYEVNLSTKVIAEKAFCDCSRLKSITIPDSVTSIGAGAFSGCSSLQQITLPFVGAKAGVTSSDTYQYPFGDIFGTSSYDGGTATRQYYYGSSTSSTTSSTYYIPTSLKSVTITGGNILRGAFYNCTGLTSITMPDSVTSIGGYAFYNCESLTSITMPDSVTSIGGYAFYNCESLTSITIPDSVTSIGSSAFSGCSSLQQITLPFVGAKAGVTSSDTYQYPFGYIFGTSSYDGSTATTQYYYGSSTSSTTSSTYYIPTSLKSVTITGDNILYGAFEGCTSLTSITMPDSVTTIGSYAFYGCTSLTSITIPSSVTSIGSYAFIHCANLEDIEVAIGNPNYCSVDGNLYDKNKTTFIQYACGKTAPNYTIPDSVTSIGNSAFSGCSSLTSITIPDSVTSIGSSAFNGCSKLTSITIPDGVTSIGGDAFLHCSSLTSITIPDSVTSIGEYAFFYCSSLTSITIPDSVTSIGSRAFSGCSSLQEITLPFVGAKAGVTSRDYYQYPFGYVFGTFSYDGSTATTQYYYGSSTSSTTSSTYYIPTSLKVVTITGGNILPGAFYNCTNLTSIIIPDSVTSIGYDAFDGCTNLTSIVIPDSVTSIGNHAFQGCSSLQQITLPFVGAKAGVTSSDTYQYPFGYIFGTSSYDGGTATRQYYYGSSTSSTTSSLYYIPTSLKSVTITGGNILYGAFYNCTRLTSVTLGNSVTSIGDDAFEGCTGLTSVTIGNGVTSIGYDAFWNCTSLTSVHITDIVAWCNILFKISSSNPLYNGGQLYINGNIVTDLVIPSSVTSIGNYAFKGYTSLTSITIPSSVTSIGNYAFQGCTSLTSITIPSSVTTIGAYAFADCTSLTSIIIPDSVTLIGGYAFKGCTSLTIYCEATSIPYGWYSSWNDSKRPVYWAGEWHYDENGNPTPN